ncbi:MAG: hypothetical protein ACREJD_05780 [Phycisphaerales bacterium]
MRTEIKTALAFVASSGPVSTPMVASKVGLVTISAMLHCLQALKRKGIVEWRGGWVLTDAGRLVLMQQEVRKAA